jgi:hypothetical protein
LRLGRQAGGGSEDQGAPQGLRTRKVGGGAAVEAHMVGMAAPVAVAAVDVRVDENDLGGAGRALHQADEMRKDSPLRELDGEVEAPSPAAEKVLETKRGQPDTRTDKMDSLMDQPYTRRPPAAYHGTPAWSRSRATRYWSSPKNSRRNSWEVGTMKMSATAAGETR